MIMQQNGLASPVVPFAPIPVLLGLIAVLSFTSKLSDGRWSTWWPLAKLVLHSEVCDPDQDATVSHVHVFALHPDGNPWSVGAWLLLVGAVLTFSSKPLLSRRMSQVGLVIGSVSLAVSTTSWLEPALLSGQIPDLPCPASAQQLSDAAVFADYARSLIPFVALTVLAVFTSGSVQDDLRTNLRAPVSSYRWRWIVSALLAMLSAAPYLFLVGYLFNDEANGAVVSWLLLPAGLPLVGATFSLVPFRSFRRLGQAAGLAALTLVFGYWSSIGLIGLSYKTQKLVDGSYRPESTLSKPQQDLLSEEKASLLVLMVLLLMVLVCSALISRLLLERVVLLSPPVVLLRAQRGSTASWVDLQQALWGLGCSTVTREGHARHLAGKGTRVLELELQEDALVLRRLGYTEETDQPVSSVPRTASAGHMVDELKRDLTEDLRPR